MRSRDASGVWPRSLIPASRRADHARHDASGPDYALQRLMSAGARCHIMVSLSILLPM
jgi:hypothetical protein